MKRVRSVKILRTDATQFMVRADLVRLNLDMPELDRKEALKLYTSDHGLMIEITRVTGDYWFCTVALPLQ